MSRPPRSHDVLQAWLLLLPAAAFVWPSLADVPTTDSAGAGLVALAALPALAFQLVRGAVARPRALALLLVVWLVAALGRTVATDTVGADRALLTLTAGAALVACGATLGAAGRRVLVLGGAAIGLTFVATAARGPAWTGLLGNTGDLSEAALIGGVLGVGAFLYGRGPLRLVGLGAAVGHALYAGLVPVHAGTVGWLAAAGVALACAPRRAGAARLARVALLAALVAVVASGGRAALAGSTGQAGDGPAPAAVRAAPALERAELGGASFRLATWRALPALVAAHPLLGVGPGQFAAAFPPFRDRAELEASSRDRAEPTPQEVEHVHNDWLEGFAEFGLVGGAAWLAFLLLVLARAVRALRGDEAERAVLGLASVALLANAAFNSNLLAGVASPALAWPVIGALLAPDAAPGRATTRAARAVPLLLTLLLALQASAAWSLFQHGRALAALPGARVVSPAGVESIDGERLERILARALAARPDSAVALEKRNQLLVAKGAGYEARLAVLRRWLAQRPHQFAAWLSLGNLQARAGNLESAREAFERAAAVDDAHPALLGNRLSLALDARDVDATRAAVDAARRAGRLDGEALRRRAADQLLLGRLGVAQVLVDAWSPATERDPSPGAPKALDVRDANASFAASRELRELGHERLADGFLCAFNLHMARDHRAAGTHESAVRMVNQALRLCRAYPELAADDGALRLELALAEAAGGQPDRARAALAEAPIRDADLRQLAAPDLALLLGADVLRVEDGRVAPVPPGQ